MEIVGDNEAGSQLSQLHCGSLEPTEGQVIIGETVLLISLNKSKVWMSAGY